MGTISVSLPADNTTADVADYNTPITTIVTAINGGLDNSNIATGAAIDSAKLAGGNTNMLSGFTSYTPTWTNLTPGNGTQSSSYVQIGKLVTVRIGMVFGSTSAITGSVTFTLPVTANSNHVQFQLLGTVTANDSGSTLYSTGVFYNNTTTALLAVFGAAATYVNQAGLSATVPFTWGVGDGLLGMFTYEAA